MQSGPQNTGASDKRTSRPSRELILRFGSAAILIPIGLVSIWCGGWILAFFAALAAGAMAYEFSRMIGYRLIWPVITVAILACLLFPINRIAAVAVLGMGGLSISVLTGQVPLRFSIFFGVIYTGGMALGVLALRGHPEIGWAMAMCVMLCTWASDTAAFFTGRAIGGPKLAPNDSPNKTWSGAIGAIIGASLSGWAFGGLISAEHTWAWAAAGALISVAAQFGDLFESQVKRRYDVKDTSGLLPGHGGVMDRVDGFGTAALIAVSALTLPGVTEILGGTAGG